jgi:hypothetical protein
MSDEEKTTTETPSNPEGGKKRRGRPPGSSKKPKAKKEAAKMYLIGAGEPLESEPKIVLAENLAESIKSFVDETETKPDDVFVFELGQKVVVKTEVSITPVE